MKYIYVRSHRVANVDDSDFDLINSYKWQSEDHGRTFRAFRTRKISDSKDLPFKIFMHRFILNAKKGQIIDHVDGNALNNQRSNLRFCTHAQNIMNGPRRLGSSSNFLGVSRRQYKTCVRWIAQYQLNGQNHRIGNFESEIEAALAYNVAASFAFREFARLNVV